MAYLEINYMDLCDDVYMELLRWRNGNGTLFYTLYPETTEFLDEYIMNYVFGNIQYELFVIFSDSAFYEIFEWHIENTLNIENITHIDFNEVYTSMLVKYLFAGSGNRGRFKQSLADAFEDSGECPYPAGTEAFDDFIDYIYDDYQYIRGFYEAFHSLYFSTWDLVNSRAEDVAIDNDIVEITTQYMR